MANSGEKIHAKCKFIHLKTHRTAVNECGERRRGEVLIWWSIQCTIITRSYRLERTEDLTAPELVATKMRNMHLNNRFYGQLFRC